MSYLSRSFVDVARDIADAVNAGNFGYYSNVFFPAATQQHVVNIEDVWYGVVSVENYLEAMDREFAAEFAKGLVPPIPESGIN